MTIYDIVYVNQIKETALSGGINKDKSRKNNQEENKDNSKSKSEDRNINSKLKIKATIVNTDQRNIQDKITQIQIKEQEIHYIENTLQKAKLEYLQAIQNQNTDEIKNKIKIKQVSKGIQNLEQQSREESSNIEIINNDQKAVDVINETIKKIDKIKNTLSKYKMQLLSLNDMIEKNKFEVGKQKNDIQKELASIECIKDKIIINPLDFIFIQGSITTGLIINVYV